MNKFRNSSGARYTKALFFETITDKTTVLYTLKDEDHEGFPSLYRLYLEEEDPLEYNFANKYLDGWEHWELLCECDWFLPKVERWRRELELKIRSEALAKIVKDADSDSKSAQMSRRFLVNGEWKPKHTKGRPTKAEITRATKESVAQHKIMQQDLDRIQKEGND